MPRIVPAVLIALAIVPLHGAEKKPVTIDAVVSPPASHAPGPPLWAPGGKRFAYTGQGALWLYDVPSGQRKKLANLAELAGKAAPYERPEAFGWQNRGVSEQRQQWSESGKEILISAGGDLLLLHVDTGAIDQLTATAFPERDPKLSPDGGRISYRRDHDLYVLDIASKKVTCLTPDGSATLLNGELDWVYPEELDLGTAHWWSPDGSRIAYLQFDIHREWRYPEADLLPVNARYEPEPYPQPGSPNADVRLGVVPAGGGETRWMDLGDTRDALLARVVWAPDSRHVFAERLNRVQNRLDLLSADADTGAVRPVLREQDPYWVNVNDVFRFLKDGKRFLWGSERSGFLHLYLYANDGKLERQITHGDWEVTDLEGVDERGGRIYYESTEASPLERQLYRIGLDGRHEQRLTATAGTHTISMGSTCEYYMDAASNVTSPPRWVLDNGEGAEVAVFRDAAPEEYEILPAQTVTVKASDGATLYARLIRPKGFQAGKKYPVVVMVYGGPHIQSVRDAWAGATFEQALAQRGFVIWQLDNRGSSGRGHAFESKVYHNLGAVELEDQEAGVRQLIGMGFADPERIGIHGWSYGGFMTLYCLTNAPSLFHAGIAGAPVADWRNYDTIYTERYMGLPAENPEGYARSTPIVKAGELTARLMLVHNLEDDNVHFQNTMQMADALERAGKVFQMLIYPQKTHGVAGPARKHMLESMAGFFEQTLR